MALLSQVFQPDEYAVYYFILAFLWLDTFWEIYLSRRQLSVARASTQLPDELTNLFTKEMFDKARLYAIDKGTFGILNKYYELTLSTAMICFGLFYHFWAAAENVTRSLNFSVDNELIVSLFFLLITNFVSTALSLPIKIYSTFVIEKKFGFNKQTPGFFIKDNIKQFLVGQAISLPLTVLAIYIIQIGGDYFFIWLWLFACVMTMILLTVYPAYIAPLFDKYTPLPDGSLRTAIENLAREQKFPLKQLYVVEGSKRSAHSNAYFTGMFGLKRIVLFDTLIKKIDPDTQVETGCEEDEIVGVLAHEIGHWALNHLIMNVIIMQLNLLLMFSVFGYMFQYGPMYTAIGFPVGQRPILVGLVAVLQLVMAPYNTILSFMMTALTRTLEFQADAYAKSLSLAEPLKAALYKLNKDNLGFPINDWLFSAWNHSHPTLIQRIEKLNEVDKKIN